MKQKTEPIQQKPSQEQLLLKDAGKIGSTMLQISLSAMKLVAGMAKVAFRASKLVIDTSLRAAKRHNERNAPR